ncbi:MAG: HAD-IIIA family hydrolase [Phycisphaerae bacterium]|nr:HAD-IIIA family hydrolase [Phycisphaerae bacterium]
MRYRALILDVDGTMTDGGLYLDDNGAQAKRFDVTDGSGIKYFQRAGGVVAFLTGRSSKVVDLRAAELGVELVIQGALDKASALAELLKRMNIPANQAAYMGDDLPDLPAMRMCGYTMAPANAAVEVREAADFVTIAAAGHGAVREAVEHLLKSDGLWGRILSRYGLPDAAEGAR